MWTAAASGPTFYYNDLAAAETFYVDEVGLSVVERAADRVVLKIASTSFLTLASGSGGLADAAKATALAVLTNTLDEWDARVTERGLPRMEGKGGGLSFLTRKPGSPHDGCVSLWLTLSQSFYLFILLPCKTAAAPQALSTKRGGSSARGCRFVVMDPEGYKIEFEQFNPHPENELLMPLLDALPGDKNDSPKKTHLLRPSILKTIILPRQARDKHRENTQKERLCVFLLVDVPTSLPGLSFHAHISWLYYRDPPAARSWHTGVLGLEMVLTQPTVADVYQTSPSGFFGAVNEANGMSDWAPSPAITLSFLCADTTLASSSLDGWIAAEKPADAGRFAADAEGAVHVHDVEGYSLEFLPVAASWFVTSAAAAPKL